MAIFRHKNDSTAFFFGNFVLVPTGLEASLAKKIHT
ncbi:hypothetical protein GLUCOINTEAF2_0200923 [Komagataeibacter intermedius AF2]|uniref:Uncharacterized protein n=1 Tax=Komagataeibacter intermedius AF2 TaxID=1458464 RepID=A0A0N1F7W1_9PROT|nr:hypothetical protein GLUCOINTEAF2_0200923 [Komagataeibacter intermedius AF2]